MNKNSNLNLLLMLWGSLSKSRKRDFYFYFLLTILASIIELVNLSLVGPFMMALAQPDKLESQELVIKLLKFCNAESIHELVFWIIFLFGATSLMANGVRLSLIWMSLKTSNSTGAEIAAEVFRRTLYQPYSVHIANNSSEIIGGVVLKANLATGVLIASTGILSSISIFSCLLMAVILLDPIIGSIAIAVFGFAYFLVGITSRKKLKENSHAIASLQVQSIKMIQESLGAVRDITLDGTQKMYAEAYKKIVSPLQAAGSWNTFIGSSPRYIMEALGTILVVILTLFLYQTKSFATILPILGTMVVAANRMLPLMQQIYSNWASINGNLGALKDVLSLLNQPLPSWFDHNPIVPLGLRGQISLEEVEFRYAEDLPWVFSKINLSINKGARIGVVGETGGGKSTLLDLVMGLLTPTKGRILVDGVVIGLQNVSAWQRSIAHVPQSIYLTDATIMENIAFGVPKESISYVDVQQAAKQARISDFIENLPESYQTRIGERGVRLSGGQKQRIGIARALYKKAQVLIFDEATSALDGETEKSVMEAIDGLSKDLTILIVSHRVDTLKNCHQIISVDKGMVHLMNSYKDINFQDQSI